MENTSNKITERKVSDLGTTSKKYPIFNNKYEILNVCGDGNSSKVFMCQSIEDNSQKVAIKVMREDFQNCK